MRSLLGRWFRVLKVRAEVECRVPAQVLAAAAAIICGITVAAASDGEAQPVPSTESVAPLSTPVSSSRIVSLAPAATEWIAALGRLDGLVGRTEDCDFPLQGLAPIPTVGKFLSPHIEAVLRLRPGMVVATDSFNPSRLAEMTRSGVSVFLLNTATIDGLSESVVKLGLLLNAEKRARELVAQMKEARPRGQGGAKGARTMLAVIDLEGRYLASRDSFVGEIFADAGWVNLAPNAGAYPQVSELWLREQRPDDVFVFQGGSGSRAEQLEAKAAVALERIWPQKLRFSQTNRPREAAAPRAEAVRVIALPSDLFMRPGPRLVQAFEMLAGWRVADRTRP